MTMRDILAALVVGGYLLISVGIIAFLPLGYADPSGVLEMLKVWSGISSLLVGAVAGSYFPKSGTGS
jgi:hypothetical protein